MSTTHNELREILQTVIHMKSSTSFAIPEAEESQLTLTREHKALWHSKLTEPSLKTLKRKFENTYSIYYLNCKPTKMGNMVTITEANYQTNFGLNRNIHIFWHDFRDKFTGL